MASAAGSSGATRIPVSPSATSSGMELTRLATIGFAQSIASRSARPNPSQRAGWTSTVRLAEQRRHVADTPRQPQPLGDAELAREEREVASLGPFAEDDQHRLRRQPGQRPHCDIQPLLLLEARHRDQHARALWQPEVGVRPPCLRRRVEPVMDDLDLVRRQPDALDAEPRERLSDRDDPRRPPGERALDEAERPRPERIVVVLGRDEPRPPAAERAVEIRVDEVCVQDVHVEPPQRGRQSRREVAPAHEPLVRHAGGGERRVERLRVPVRIVEADHPCVHVERAQRREQREEVPLRPADAADPVDVRDLHASRRARTRSAPRTSAAAASRARRKSHGIR